MTENDETRTIFTVDKLWVLAGFALMKKVFRYKFNPEKVISLTDHFKTYAHFVLDGSEINIIEEMFPKFIRMPDFDTYESVIHEFQVMFKACRTYFMMHIKRVRRVRYFKHVISMNCFGKMLIIDSRVIEYNGVCNVDKVEHLMEISVSFRLPFECSPKLLKKVMQKIADDLDPIYFSKLRYLEIKTIWCKYWRYGALGRELSTCKGFHDENTDKVITFKRYMTNLFVTMISGHFKHCINRSYCKYDRDILPNSVINELEYVDPPNPIDQDGINEQAVDEQFEEEEEEVYEYYSTDSEDLLDQL